MQEAPRRHQLILTFHQTAVCSLSDTEDMWANTQSSRYYLMFAVVFGLPEGLALEFIHITLVVVVLSIIIHGLTVKPMMSKWW